MFKIYTKQLKKLIILSVPNKPFETKIGVNFETSNKTSKEDSNLNLNPPPKIAKALIIFQSSLALPGTSNTFFVFCKRFQEFKYNESFSINELAGKKISLLEIPKAPCEP